VLRIRGERTCSDLEVTHVIFPIDFRMKLFLVVVEAGS